MKSPGRVDFYRDRHAGGGLALDQEIKICRHWMVKYRDGQTAKPGVGHAEIGQRKLIITLEISLSDYLCCRRKAMSSWVISAHSTHPTPRPSLSGVYPRTSRLRGSVAVSVSSVSVRCICTWSEILLSRRLCLGRYVKVKDVHGEAEGGTSIGNVYDTRDDALDRGARQEEICLFSRVSYV